jgi:pentatricopeptide repeat protein
MLAAYLRGGLARLRPPLPTAGLASSARPGIELLDSLWDKETPLGESSAYRRHRHEQGYSQKKKIKQRHRNVRRADRATAAMATAEKTKTKTKKKKIQKKKEDREDEVGPTLGGANRGAAALDSRQHNDTHHFTSSELDSEWQEQERRHWFPGDWGEASTRSRTSGYAYREPVPKRPAQRKKYSKQQAKLVRFVESGDLKGYHLAWLAFNTWRSRGRAHHFHLAHLLRTCHNSQQMLNNIVSNMHGPDVKPAKYQKVCRYGSHCKRPGCWFRHPGRNGRTPKIPYGKAPYAILAEQYLIEGQLQKAKKLIDQNHLDRNSAEHISVIIKEISEGHTDKVDALTLGRLQQWKKEGTVEGTRHAIGLVSEPALYFETSDALSGDGASRLSPAQWEIPQPAEFFEELKGIFLNGYASPGDVWNMIEDGMPASGVTPDASVYALLARQYVIEGDIEMAEDVLEDHMQSAGITPNLERRNEIARNLVRVDVSGLDAGITSSDDLRDLIEVGLGAADTPVWHAELHDGFDQHASDAQSDTKGDGQSATALGSILAKLKSKEQRSGHIILSRDQIPNEAALREMMEKALSPRGMRLSWGGDVGGRGEDMLPSSPSEDFDPALERLDEIWMDLLRRDAWLDNKPHEEIGKFRYRLLQRCRRENTIASNNRAVSLFQNLVDNGVANTHHYNVMAGLLLKAGEDVVAFIRDSQDKMFLDANTATYNSLIHSYLLEGDRDSAERIVEHEMGAKNGNRPSTEPNQNTFALLAASDGQLARNRTNIFRNCRTESETMSKQDSRSRLNFYALSLYDPVLSLPSGGDGSGGGGSGGGAHAGFLADELHGEFQSEPPASATIVPRLIPRFSTSFCANYSTATPVSYWGNSPKDRAIRLMQTLDSNGIGLTYDQMSHVMSLCNSSEEMEAEFPRERLSNTRDFNFLLTKLMVEGDDDGIAEVKALMDRAAVVPNEETGRILSWSDNHVHSLRGKWLQQWLIEGTRESRQTAEDFFAMLEERNKVNTTHYVIMQRWPMASKEHRELIFERMPSTGVLPSERNFALLVQQLLLEGCESEAWSIITKVIPEMKKDGKFAHDRGRRDHGRVTNALIHFMRHEKHLIGQLRTEHLLELIADETYDGLSDAAQFLQDMTQNGFATSYHYACMIRKIQSFGYGEEEIEHDNGLSWGNTALHRDIFSYKYAIKKEPHGHDAAETMLRIRQLGRGVRPKDVSAMSLHEDPMKGWDIRDSKDIEYIINKVMQPAGIAVDHSVWEQLVLALVLEGNMASAKDIVQQQRDIDNVALDQQQDLLSSRRTAYMRLLLRNGLREEGMYFFDRCLMENKVATVDHWNLRLKWCGTSDEMQRKIDQHMTGEEGVKANLETYIFLVEQMVLEGKIEPARKTVARVLGADVPVPGKLIDHMDGRFGGDNDDGEEDEEVIIMNYDEGEDEEKEDDGDEASWVRDIGSPFGDDEETLSFDMASTPVLSAYFHTSGISDYAGEKANVWHINRSREFIRKNLEAIFEFPSEKLDVIRAQALSMLYYSGDEAAFGELSHALEENHAIGNYDSAEDMMRGVLSQKHTSTTGGRKYGSTTVPGTWYQ